MRTPIRRKPPVETVPGSQSATDPDRLLPAIDLGVAWTKDDFVTVLGNIAGFLREQQRGFPRFISIVKGRN